MWIPKNIVKTYFVENSFLIIIRLSYVLMKFFSLDKKIIILPGKARDVPLHASLAKIHQYSLSSFYIPGNRE